jgi:hypothetical protein
MQHGGDLKFLETEIFGELEFILEKYLFLS